MREVLFRGIIKNDNSRCKRGQWAFGDLVRLQDGNDGKPHIYGYGEVIPETVGQYTGLTDKNDKEVFEGDIVVRKWDSGNAYIYEVIFDTELCSFIAQRHGAFSTLDDEFEIIGNIHDNPELLKGGAE